MIRGSAGKFVEGVHDLDVGALVAQVDKPTKVVQLSSVPSFMKLGDEIRRVHVMRPGDGEVRSYVIWRGRLFLMAPCYTGTWREVDVAVERATTCDLEPYVATSGGGLVRFPDRVCYACDAPATGHRDRRLEVKDGKVEKACKRHADPELPTIGGGA